MDSKKMREYKYIRNTLPISNRHMNGENLVEFSIDSEKYDFEEGMTWNDWVNSAFNTDGYIIDGSTIANSDKNLWVASNSRLVQVTTKIIENYEYQVM